MEDKKIRVAIEYEREVINTAEGVALASILADIGQLTSREDFGKSFRAIYGTVSENDIEKLRRDVREIESIYSKAVLVSESGRTSTALKGTVVTPSAVAEELNDRISAFPRPGGGIWGANDFIEPFAAGAENAFRLRYGATLTTISNEEIDAVERVNDLAASLGLRLEDVNAADLPTFRTGTEKEIDAVKVVAHYVAHVDDPNRPLAATGDFLRFNAQRPGGINFSASQSAYPPSASFAADLQTALGDDPRQDPVPVLLNEAQRRGLTLEQYLRNPNANTTRDSNYGVLRIIRGYQPGFEDPFGTEQAFEILFQTNKFLLTSVNEQQMERTSFVETFGDTYLYLFGTKAKVWNYTGELMDTRGLDWVNSWRSAYDRYMKGSASTKLRATAYLIYNNVVRQGIIVASGIGQSNAQYGFARFNFQMFVLNEYFLSGDPDPSIPEGLPTVFDIQETRQNREERYAITGPRDVTPQKALAATSSAEKAARAAADALFERQRAAVEARILDDAFPGGRLARRSGTVLLDISDAMVLAALEQVEAELNQISTAAPTAPVTGNFSSGPSYAAFAIP